ncbi:hypothetical protein H9L19_05515 [Weissella diestrammenae]|uniref:Methyl-accepting transducer domain-containing protein n=1 Tax=Weissella diestrammenae TaxID=1162633 RepID=A0A7G9T432_9LACO|nr:hypothetical protein [Weissella diestrammenae]MCM0583379.1 hypothetical protein [Weissella diestrammenae]QNN74857.1 hypothetical protein H9L19_05515 [Weissella diestrammenae]
MFTISYVADAQTVTVNYVDDDNGGATITAKNTTVASTTDKTLTITPDVSGGYLLVDSGQSTISYQTTADANQSITIHLKHAHTQSTVQATLQVNFTGAKTNPEAQSQVVSYAADLDQVTGVTTYTRVGNDVSVTVPTIAGYRADQTGTINGGYATTLSSAPSDQTVIVTYTAEPQTLTINYVDAITGDVIATDTFNGVTDQAVSYNPATSGRVPTGYTIDASSVIPTALTASANQTATVTLNHVMTNGTYEVTQTVTYSGLPSAKTPANQTQVIHFDTVTDEALQTTTYTPVSGGDALVSPIIAGYTASVASVPVTAYQTSTTQPVGITTNVTYTANEQQITVKYVDDDNAGAQVGAIQTLQVPSDQSINFTADIPTHYVLVTTEGATVADDNDSQTQSITVHLAHAHAIGTATAIQTVTYTGAGSLTPTDTITEVTFASDTDLVAQTTVYTRTSTNPTITVPTIAGYSISQAGTSGYADTMTSAPTNQMLAVTYSADAQQIIVSYLDKDNGNQVVATTTISGVTNGTASFDPATKLPNGLTIASADVPTTFTADSQQTGTVYVTHNHTAGTVTVAQTVTYAGAGSATPASVTAPITYTTDKDDYTGVITYTRVGDDVSIVTPEVAGYTASQSVINGNYGQTATSMPAAQSTTVTYTADVQSITVRYVDASTGATIATDVIKGVTDGAVTYDPSTSGLVQTGYSIDAANSSIPATFTALADQTATVTLMNWSGEATSEASSAASEASQASSAASSAASAGDSSAASSYNSVASSAADDASSAASVASSAASVASSATSTASSAASDASSAASTASSAASQATSAASSAASIAVSGSDKASSYADNASESASEAQSSAQDASSAASEIASQASEVAQLASENESNAVVSSAAAEIAEASSAASTAVSIASSASVVASSAASDASSAATAASTANEQASSAVSIANENASKAASAATVGDSSAASEYNSVASSAASVAQSYADTAVNEESVASSAASVASSAASVASSAAQDGQTAASAASSAAAIASSAANVQSAASSSASSAASEASQASSAASSAASATTSDASEAGSNASAATRTASKRLIQSKADGQSDKILPNTGSRLDADTVQKDSELLMALSALVAGLMLVIAKRRKEDK